MVGNHSLIQTGAGVECDQGSVAIVRWAPAAIAGSARSPVPLWAELRAPFSKHEMGFMLAELKPVDLQALADLMQSGQLTPVIDRSFPLRGGGAGANIWRPAAPGQGRRHHELKACQAPGSSKSTSPARAAEQARSTSVSVQAVYGRRRCTAFVVPKPARQGVPACAFIGSVRSAAVGAPPCASPSWKLRLRQIHAGQASGAAHAAGMPGPGYHCLGPGQIAVPRSPHAAAEDVRRFCTTHRRWVIEGCYASLIPGVLRVSAATGLPQPRRGALPDELPGRPGNRTSIQAKAEQDQRLPFLLSWVSSYYRRDDDMSLAASHRACFEDYTGKQELSSVLSEDIPADQNWVGPRPSWAEFGVGARGREEAKGGLRRPSITLASVEHDMASAWLPPSGRPSRCTLLELADLLPVGVFVIA